MPINVQHGVPASPGLAGLAQAQMQIDAQAAGTGRGGGGGGGGWAPRGRSGGGGRGGAGSSAANAQMQAYLEGQLQEQSSGLAIEEMREEAQLEAEQFDYEFTNRQRQEIARLNEAEQRINSSEEFSEQEKHSARFAIEQKRIGIQPSSIPADRNRMKFPPNQAQSINGTWTDEAGNTWAYDRSGSAVMRQEFKDTADGITQQASIERKSDLQKAIMEYSTTPIEDATGLGTGKLPSDAQIDTHYKKLSYASEVVEAGGPEKLKAIKKAEKEALDAATAPPPPWHKEFEARGMKVTKDDKDLHKVNPELAELQVEQSHILNNFDPTNVPGPVRDRLRMIADEIERYRHGEGAFIRSRQAEVEKPKRRSITDEMFSGAGGFFGGA